MQSILVALFGQYLPLVRHIVQNTLMFLVLLICLFVVRSAIKLLFTESDFVVIVLHVVDAYAVLLGIIGFIVWTSLDMFLLLRHQLMFKKGKK